MTYEQFITNIIMSRGQYNCAGYKERHHIIPRCMGGVDDKSNIIYLYPREHYEAHKLLALENPDNHKLNRAWWLMSHINNTKYEVTSNEYEQSKESFGKFMSQDMRDRWKTKQFQDLMKEALVNSWNTDARRKRHREAMDEYWADESRREIQSHKRKMYLDTHPEAKKYLSEINMGENSPMWGKRYGEHPGAKPIMCIETGQMFSCGKEAEDVTGINRSNICAVLKGNRHYAGRHPETGEPLHWVYVEFKDDIGYMESIIDEINQYKYKYAVYCPELNKVYLSCTIASEETGIAYPCIWNCCHGKSSYAGKHPETGEKLHWYQYNYKELKEAK